MSEDVTAAESGKLFVGALAGVTNKESLQQYFSKFGEVIDSVIMMDKVTHHSRGFGFVTFRDPQCVHSVLQSRPHILDNKEIDPKPCTPKAIQLEKRNAAIEHIQTHKVFVGGISKDADQNDVQEYFEKYGVVTEVSLVLDSEDHKHRGYGFVTFQEAHSVDEVVKIHFHNIKGKKVETKRAKPRDKMLTGTVRPPHKESQSQSRPMKYTSNGYGSDAAYMGPAPSRMSQGPSGGWMPGAPGPGAMMGPFGYGGFSSGYYGFDCPPPPSDHNMPFHGGVYGRGPSSYGPFKSAPPYGMNSHGNGDTGYRRPGNAGYHPYKR